MSGFDNEVLYANNVDFTGTTPVSGQINLNGELLVGATTAPFIRAYVPTGTNGVSISTGPGTLDFSLASVPNSALTNSTINVIAGTGLTGGGNVALGGSVTLNASGTGTVTNVSGTANQVAVATGTTTPVISLVGPYTPATYTAHGVLIGEGTSSITATTAGSTGQHLQSQGASADPTWTTATFPATATGTGKVLRADGTNWVATTATYPDTAGTSGNFLVSDGTNWTSTDLGVLTYTAAITLTSAQIKALHATPIQIVAQPGSGKVIYPIKFVSKFTYGGTNVFVAAAAQTIRLYWGTAAPATPATNILLFNSALVGTTSGYGFSNEGSSGALVVTTNCENLALNAYNDVATEITGNAGNNNTLHISVLYIIVNL